jgi:hypothetical protein
VKAVLVAAVLASSALAGDRPHLVASAQVTPMTSLPDFLSAFVTVHAIPYVDLQGGASFFPGTFGWWVRGGPRVLFNDWRDDQHRGLTWRVALLGGYRAFRDTKGDARGVSFVLANDFTYFLTPHLGLTLSVSGGGLYDVPGQRFLPELRLGLGVTL